MCAYTLQKSNLKVFQRILMTPNNEKLAMNRSVNNVRIQIQFIKDIDIFIVYKERVSRKIKDSLTKPVP